MLMLASHVQIGELGRIYIGRLVHFRIPPGQVVLAPTSSYLVTVKLQTGGRVQLRVEKVNIPHHHRLRHRHLCRTLSIYFGIEQAAAVDLV